jgi:formamidopyrimidine-DNA glycosylase
MAKVYFAATDDLGRIPAYRTLGVDVLSPEFSEELFLGLARDHQGKQVRSFINNHALLSAIGNAYADEILFEARLHPKTFVRTCSDDDLRRLYSAIRTVLQWGIQEVRNAGQPIHVKVREHVRVRNRRGKPCPRCGTTIRREGVRGYDVFFCPACQPATRTPFVDWRSIPTRGETGR